MVSKEVVVYLKAMHGSFNSVVFILFCYQGWAGPEDKNS